MTTLVKPDEYVLLWAIIVLGSSAAIWLEQKYKWAARVSGPVVALLIAMALSNTGVVPAESPAYDFVGTWLVPIAIPLLLFRANIFRILRTTGRLLVCFHVSTAGTLLGVMLAVLALRGKIGSPAAEHAGGIMAGSYIGGAVNFFAITENYKVASSITNPLIVADNFVMAGIFILLISIAGRRFFQRLYPSSRGKGSDKSSGEIARPAKALSTVDLAQALAFAFLAVAVAELLGRGVRHLIPENPGASLGLQMLRTLCTNKFVLLTASSLFFATVLHKPLAAVNGPEEIGSYLLYLFLFVIGLPADFRAVLGQAPLFFVFCGIIALTNLAFTLLVGRLCKLPLEELLLAVNANLGGAPTAAAMAVSCEWKHLVLPGLLAGIWGYVIGTPLGIMMVELWRH